MTSLRLWHRVILPATAHFRARRGRFLLEHFPDIRRMRICDLGGSRHFWDNLGIDVPRENITIFNISEGETESVSGKKDDGIDFRIYDGKNIPAADDQFDLLVCNSVLEHVPTSERKALGKEMSRVARAVFCQTPAWSFPLEPHFIMPFVHWLPASVGFRLMQASPWRILSRPSAQVIREYFYGTKLLKEDELRGIFPGCVVHHEMAFGLVKSYMAVHRKTSGMMA